MSIFDELNIDSEQIDKEARIGPPQYSEIDGAQVIDIPVTYDYKGKTRTFKIRVIPDQQISTVLKKTPTDEPGVMDTEIVAYGMDREDIEKFFPPTSSTSSLHFNLMGIIRSIIFEAFLKRDIDILSEGNVRGFYYTHLIHTIQNALGLTETVTVKSTINKAWEDLIVSGLVTYEAMNIESGKLMFTHSVVKDSPFANIIIAVEKEDKFKTMTWLPKLFNCTLITAGGQPSRANARNFILDLRDKARVNLNQQFYMCVVSDLDPAGYYIQDSFVNQLERAIQYYGGSGKIEIKRLFVRRDQVTEVLLNHDAIPCYDKAKSPQAKKGEDTKWKYFCKETDGGVYKKVERVVALEIGAIDPDDEVGQEYVKVRAKLELNAFPNEILNTATVNALLEIIEETSDESLIMIPEIMRIFEQERQNAMDDIFEGEYNIQIKPSVREFLRSIDVRKRELEQKTKDEEEQVWDEYWSIKKEVEAPFNEQIEELQEEADARVPDELKKRERIEGAIARLNKMLDAVNKDIREKTHDILENIEEVLKERNEELLPHENDRNEKLEDVEERGKYRGEELEKFRREKETLFNPAEMALKKDIKAKVEQNNLPFFFEDVETDEKIARHISKLLNSPDALLEEGTPCLEQEYPVFKEDDLLHQASAEKSENVEPYRKGFTEDFLRDMRQFILNTVEEEEIIFEAGEIEEFEDFSDELDDVVERIEDDIENERYKEEFEEEESE